MKWLVYVLSLWLLLLSGLPCPDADCHAHETRPAASLASHANDEHENDHKAPCSPFCHCATCLGFSAPQPFSYTRSNQPAVKLITQQLFAYSAPNLADVAIAIWQPPKLRV